MRIDLFVLLYVSHKPSECNSEVHAVLQARGFPAQQDALRNTCWSLFEDVARTAWLGGWPWVETTICGDGWVEAYVFFFSKNGLMNSH